MNRLLKIAGFLFSAVLLLSDCAGGPPPAVVKSAEDAEVATETEATETEAAETEAVETEAAETEAAETEAAASSEVEESEDELPDAGADSTSSEVEESEQQVPGGLIKPENQENLRKIPVKPEEPGKTASEELKPAPSGNVTADYLPQISEETETPPSVSEKVEEAEDESPVHINPLLETDRPYISPVPAVKESVDSPIRVEEEKTLSESGDNTGMESGSVAASLPEESPEITRDSVSSDDFQNPAVSAAAPSRILEGPGEFTITLEGQGWIFRSDRSSPGSWRFLERKLEGNATDFRFRFTETGSWNLVFEKQDLSSGGSESAVRHVVVSQDSAIPRIENGPISEGSVNPISGNIPSDSESRNQAALDAEDEGRVEEALEFWEVDASRDDDAGRRARASLVESAVKSGSVNPLITWLPEYMKDGPDNEILASALDVFERQAGYDAQSRMILERLAAADTGDREPEWLFRLASYLEKPGAYRNLDRSAALYQEVISGWPLSDWRDKSEERLLWLQRHYFRVR